MLCNTVNIRVIVGDSLIYHCCEREVAYILIYWNPLEPGICFVYMKAKMELALAIIYSILLNISYVVLFQSLMDLSFSSVLRYDPFPLLIVPWNSHKQGGAANFHTFFGDKAK